MSLQVNQQIFPSTESGTVDESSNVDRIRKILFGSQMRDYDTRFQELEERLRREFGELRGDLHRQLQGFVFFIKGEVESISHRVNTEQSERVESIQQLAHEMGETSKILEQKISLLDSQAAREIGELRERLLEETKALGDEMREKHDQVKGRLEHETGQIREAMTGREALAELFTDLATRLKNEKRAPDAS